VLAVPKPNKHSVDWQPYSSTSVAAAIKAHKPIMIDFTAEWCIACRELETGPFSDPKVIKSMDGVERFRVDGTKQTEAVKAAGKNYSVKGYPTVIFIGRSGDEAGRIVGPVDSRDMLKRIDSIK